jgi:hypothetical protein
MIGVSCSASKSNRICKGKASGKGIWLRKNEQSRISETVRRRPPYVVADIHYEQDISLLRIDNKMIRAIRLLILGV